MGNRYTVSIRRHRTNATQVTDYAVSVRRVKVLVMGDTGVGKTTLCRRLLDQTIPSEYLPTTSAVLGAKLVHLEGDTPVIVELWDVPHRMYSGIGMMETYLRGAEGIILVYDVTSRASYQTLLEYHKLVTQHPYFCGNSTLEGSDERRSLPPLVLVGNKIDSLVKVKASDTIKLAEQWVKEQESACISHRTVSAMVQEGTVDLLRVCVHAILHQRDITLKSAETSVIA